MHYRLEGHNLLKEFRVFFDEPWGTTMHWWFTIAEELHRREGKTPAHWNFSPSILGGSKNDPDDHATQMCIETGSDGLVFAGNVLWRYAKLLSKHGWDY